MDPCYLEKEECNLKQTKDDFLLNVWPRTIAETMVHEIFLINCFIFDIAVVCKTVHSWAMTKLKLNFIMEKHCNELARTMRYC